MKRIRRILLVCFTILLVSVQAGKPIKVVVLDAGHGGEDPGAIGITGVNEKTINLAIVLKLGKLIEQQYPDIKVIYTRKTDVFVKLNRRAQIANEQHADVFISIHCNSATSASSYGTETFVMGMDKSAANLELAQKENASILLESNTKENYGDFDPNSPEAYIIFSLYQNAYLTQSLSLASNIQSELKNTLSRVDRGVKQAPLLVLWKTTMPSILVEAGFLSNKTEESYLNSEKGQNELATAIFVAFCKMVDDNAEKSVTINNDTTTDKIEKKSKVTYKVQFMTLNRKLTANDPALKGLPDIDVVKVNENTYIYSAGKASTYDEILSVKEIVKKCGYADAFITAFDMNNNRISITEAKKLEIEK